MNEKQVEREIDFYQRYRNRAVQGLIEAGRNEYSAWQSKDWEEATSLRIEAWEPSMPANASRFLEADVVEGFAQIVDELAQINNGYEGEIFIQASVNAWEEVETSDLLARTFRWVEMYVEDRAQRKNPRDHDRFEKFLRLLCEASKLFEPLLPQATLARPFLKTVFGCVVWNVYRATWRGKLFWDARGVARSLTEVPPQHRYWVEVIEKRNSWAQDDLLLRMSSHVGTLDCPEEGRDFKMMAKDICAMKPLLVDTPPESFVVQAGEFLWTSLLWNCSGWVADVPTAENEALIKEAIALGAFPFATLCLGDDGLFAPFKMPWQTPDHYSAEHRDRILTLNRRILESVHGVCFDLWEKLDHRGTEEALLVRSEQVQLSQEEDLKLLASHEARIATEVSPQCDAQPKTERLVQSQRIQPILNKLETFFGCKVRNGKGSEVVVYRNGEKPFRFGKHGQNPEVFVGVLRRALQNLGIPVGDWVRATQ